MDLVITILGWIALGVISAYLLAIVGKIIFDAATADYKLYKHVRLCRKRLLRQRYEDYAWLLLQLEKLLSQACNLLDEYDKGGATQHNLLWKAMGNIEDVLKELEDSYGISLL